MKQSRSICIAVGAVVLAYFYQHAINDGVRIVVKRTMVCSAETSFSAITNFETMKKVSPEVIDYEITKGEEGSHEVRLGMKFSERRNMGEGNNPLVTNLHVVECNRPQIVRMVADTHGTIWDTTFRVKEEVVNDDDDNTSQVLLEISMHAKAHEIIPKLSNPIMQVLFWYGLSKYISNVKIWCENQ